MKSKSSELYLGIDGGQTTTLGGLLGDSWLWKYFAEGVKRRIPGVAVARPRMEAHLGTVLLALRLPDRCRAHPAAAERGVNVLWCDAQYQRNPVGDYLLPCGRRCPAGSGYRIRKLIARRSS
jgi:hypothetical protein